MTADQLPAEVRALLAERRARTYGRDRFEASTRRAAQRIIRTTRKDTPVTSTALNVAETKATVLRAWTLFTKSRHTDTALSSWETSHTPDGSLCLTAQVFGPGVAEALHRFTADYPLNLAGPGDRLPRDEYRDGRVVTVWRTGGVWVELWHPDPPQARTTPPAPRQARTAPPVGMRAVITRSPSGRLTIAQRLTAIRRQHTTKEN